MNIQVATLSLVEGQLRANPSEMGKAPIRQGMLFILVEVSAPTEEWDTASRELVDRIIGTFVVSKSSETAALRGAVLSVNDYLLTYNQNLPEDDRIWAGVNVAYMQAGQLLLAQAGPALTYIVRGHLITHYPQDIDELQPESPSMIALGTEPEPTCRLARFSIQPNDLVVLAASHLPTFSHKRQIEQAIQETSAPQVTVALQTLAKKQDFSALVVQYEPTSVTAPPSSEPAVTELRPPQAGLNGQAPRTKGTKEQNSSSPSAAKRRKKKMPKAVSPTMTDKPSEATVFASEAETRPHVVHTPATNTAQIDDYHVADEQDNPDFSSGVALWRRLLAGLFFLISGLFDGLHHFIELSEQQLQPSLAATAPTLDRIAHRFWSSLDQMWHFMRRILRQLLPGDHASPAKVAYASPPPKGDGSDFFRLLSILTPLIMLLLVTTLWFWQADDNPVVASSPEVVEEETNSDLSYDELVANAQAYLGQAQGVDEKTAQALLQQANELIEQAMLLAPDDEAFNQLDAMRTQAQELLNRTSDIAQAPVMTLASLEAEGNPVTLVYGTNTLFAFDQVRSAIYHLPATVAPTTVLQARDPLLGSQEVLEGQATVTGIPHVMAWVPAGGNRPYNGLVILTANGQTFDYDTGSGMLSRTDTVILTSDIQASEGYDGNLYLLDRVKRQIWKYIPGYDGQYTSAVPWLNATGQSELGTPIDMAIDGYIFLLDESGVVKRFSAGQQTPDFALAPINPALTSPVAMAKMPPEASDLFVAEQQRVIRFDNQGNFLIEYRSPLSNNWGTIRDIAINPAGNHLYVLSDKGLFLMDVTGYRQAPPAAASESGE